MSLNVAIVVNSVVKCRRNGIIFVKSSGKQAFGWVRMAETENGTGPILKTDEGDGTISILKDAILEQLHRIGPVPFSLLKC